MPRFYVFPDQASAQAWVAGVNARDRQIYAAQGYEVDAQGAIVGKRASDGADQPSAARTQTWDMPRQRVDGKWVVAHCEGVPGALFVLNADATPPLTVAAFVARDIAASVPIETDDASWWILPPYLRTVG